jgi:hypothetical protein
MKFIPFKYKILLKIAFRMGLFISVPWLVGGCQRLEAPPRPISQPQISAPPTSPSGKACLTLMAAQEKVRFKILRPPTLPALLPASSFCQIETPISLEQLSISLNRPVTIDCALAPPLLAWINDVVTPASQQFFAQPVRSLVHVGGYDCRPIARTKRLSEHAYGRALDIAGFILADGRAVSFLKDWGKKPPGQFLAQIADGACLYFSVVLSPKSDQNHRDHLHLDIGRQRLCQRRD